jgi:hypothetical protein
MVNRSRRAFVHLFSALPADLRPQVASVPQGYAFGLWDFLEKKFRNTETDNLVDLWMGFTALEQKTGETFSAYKARVDHIRMLLKHAKEPMSESLYCGLLLWKLQPEYGSAVLAARAGGQLKDAKLVNWEEMVAFMNNQERSLRRLEGGNGEEGEGEEGSAASSQKAAPSEKSMSAGAKGGYKGKGGWKPAGGASSHGGGKAWPNPNIECFACHEHGHIASKCPNMKGGGGGKPPGGAAAHAAGSWGDDNRYRYLSDEEEEAEDDDAAPKHGMAQAAQAAGQAPEAPAKSRRWETAFTAAAAPAPQLQRLVRPGEQRPGGGGSVASKPPVVPSKVASPEVRNNKLKAAVRKEAAPAAAPQQRQPPPSPRPAGKPAVAAAPKQPLHKALGKAGGTWGIDSMCSHHVSGDKGELLRLRRCETVPVEVADGSIVYANHSGSVVLRVQVVGREQAVRVRIDNVLYNEKFSVNLLSWGMLKTDDWKLHSDKEESYLITPGKNKVMLSTRGRVLTVDKARPERVFGVGAFQKLAAVDEMDRTAAGKGGRRIRFEDEVLEDEATPFQGGRRGEVVLATAGDIVRLHQRLAHTGFTTLMQMCKEQKTDDIGRLTAPPDEIQRAKHAILNCVGCAKGKGKRTAFGHRGLDRGQRPGEVLHMDVFFVNRPDGVLEYGLTVKDGFSDAKWTARCRKKSDVVGEVIAIIAASERQSGSKVKRLNMDGGSEFVNDTLRYHCRGKGIELHHTPAKTPQLNSIAERDEGTTKGAVGAMLHHARAPRVFWHYAMMHHMFVWNRTHIAPRTGITPIESITGKRPSARHLGVFGCDAFMLVPKHKRTGDTFASKMEPAIYLGHDFVQNCATVYVMSKDAITRSRDVDLREGSFTHCAALATGTGQDAAKVTRAILQKGYYLPAGEDCLDCDDLGDSVPPSPSQSAPIQGGEAVRRDRAEERKDDDEPKEEPRNREWDVKRVIGERSERRGNRVAKEFLVEWEGDQWEPTWEPERHLANSKDAIADFRAERAKGEQQQDGHHEEAAEQPASKQDEEDDESEEVAPMVRMAMGAVIADFGIDDSANASLQVEQHSSQGLAKWEVVQAVQRAMAMGEQQPAAKGIHLMQRTTPVTFQDAMKGADRERWKASMDREIASCEANKTWTKVKRSTLPPGANVLPCKWVYKIKLDEHGGDAQDKSRITPKGFKQRHGIDFDEVFASTGKYKTLRAFTSICTRNRMRMGQMDVPSAFCKPLLKELVFMQMPQGYEEDGMVLRLDKSLYGLKQAGRNWKEMATNFIVGELKFTMCKSDPNLFYKRTRTNRLLLLFLYVDDLRGGHDDADLEEWKEIKKALYDKFQTKDLGEATMMLGMRITRDWERHTTKIDQELYITQALEKFGLTECKVADTPAVANACDEPETKAQHEKSVADGSGKPADRQRYMEMVGTLLYAAISTRPDIAFAVGLLTRFMQEPLKRHEKAAERVFRYLAGTKSIGLVYGRNRDGTIDDAKDLAAGKFDVSVFCDADWAGDKATRKSTTGWMAKVGGDLVSWASKKQRTVALSSTEAELYAESAAFQELLWQRGLLTELGLLAPGPSVARGDNQSTLAVTKNGIKGERTKHVDIRHCFVTDCIENGDVKLEWVETKNQQADIFTKALPAPQFLALRKLIMSE